MYSMYPYASPQGRPARLKRMTSSRSFIDINLFCSRVQQVHKRSMLLHFSPLILTNHLFSSSISRIKAKLRTFLSSFTRASSPTNQYKNYANQLTNHRRRGPGGSSASGGGSLVLFDPSTSSVGGTSGSGAANQLVVSRRAAPSAPKPDWHAPWKLAAVVSGHLGWVRAVAFDPGNEWFVTGSADRTIKVCVVRTRIQFPQWTVFIFSVVLYSCLTCARVCVRVLIRYARTTCGDEFLPRTVKEAYS